MDRLRLVYGEVTRWFWFYFCVEFGTES